MFQSKLGRMNERTNEQPNKAGKHLDRGIFFYGVQVLHHRKRKGSKVESEFAMNTSQMKGIKVESEMTIILVAEQPPVEVRRR